MGVTGTDATIADHIAKIIDREYVMKSEHGGTQYLTPSTLGIGLVEGYNTIGFDKSLTRPLLRREVCGCFFKKDLFAHRLTGLNAFLLSVFQSLFVD
jgi:hypothetical protein